MIAPKPHPSIRLLRRPKVTLCIAAMCEVEADDPRVVLCTDWRQESYLAHSETADKLRILPNGWIALVADTASRDEELVALYESHLLPLTKFKDDAELFSEMKKPAQQYKANLANEYISHTVGMSYSDFLSKDNIPEDFFTKRLNEISQIRLDASLILAGFVAVRDPKTKKQSSAPYLFVVEDDEGHQDVVRTEDNFAVIGSGRYVAVPSLTQRGLDSSQSLMETIYAVYEAKRLAETVPGVGEYTSIDVLDKNGDILSITDKGYERCKELFAKLGPRLNLSEKKKSEFFKVKDGFLGPFEDESKPTSKKTAKKPRKFYGTEKPMPGENLGG